MKDGVLYRTAAIKGDTYQQLVIPKSIIDIHVVFTQVSYRFLTADNFRLVLSRGSFLLWWRGGLVP